MLPLSAGFLLAGPISGRLADHYGARPFTFGGMILSAIGLLLLTILPVDFTYWVFGLIIFVIGFAMGLFAAPNQTGIMNSLPPDQRGAGAGMAATFMGSRIGAVDRDLLQPDHHRTVLEAPGWRCCTASAATESRMRMRSRSRTSRRSARCSRRFSATTR